MINSFVEPAKVLKSLNGNSEMTESQLGFLCGIIKEKRPRKIVEVGVASGGTTAVLLHTINLLHLDAKLFSVDKSENFYRNSTLKTGYMATDYLEKESKNQKLFWKMLSGRYLPEVIDEIGDGIDLLILDTMHVLPGEIMDFLVALPYLSPNAIVILHDVALHHMVMNSDAFATQVLLDVVTAEEIQPMDCDDVHGCANIGAFAINRDTFKYINKVFGALRLTWNYVITETEKQLYYNAYMKHYRGELADVFLQSYDLNKETYEKRLQRDIRNDLDLMIFTSQIVGRGQIYIYMGMEIMAKRLSKY